MILGLRTKTRRSPSVHLDYIIHIQEIKPWPPSQSLRALRSVLIQWDHGNKTSGLSNQVVPSLSDGTIEFNESIRISTTLTREISIKNGDGETFQKNCIEFNLYEPRRDKIVKGQLLGTAVLDLADYGVIRENLSVSVPINCKRTIGKTAQPLLFVKIQRTRSRDSLRREASMDSNRAESVSALMSEEYAEEEAEVGSFTTDDDVSSHSSLAVASSAAESNGSGSPQNKENETVAANGSGGEATVGHIQDQFVDGFTNDESSKKHKKYAEERRIVEEKEQQIEDELIVTLENGLLLSTKNNFAVNSNSSSIDRSKNGRSVRSSLDSTRSNGSIRSSEAKDATKETRNMLSDSRVRDLENRIKNLEGELREAAGIEVSLYSVVAEHGSSMTKVHAPARRLSRLYFHASKHNSKSRSGSAAKSIVSGLVLVAKACGNDVPRLTFWLSNCIVLRVIMNKSFGDNQLPISVGPVVGKSRDENRKKNSSPLKWESFTNKSTRSAIEESFGDWENPLIFAGALEKVEAWIFSRIIESIWWQTFTPHMQSGAAKAIRKSMNSELSKLYKRTSSSIDQQQGNFSVELWKNAFKDACETICPVRAEGHDCGCLPVLSRLIMEQLIARLDVAMFNAMLRESADEIPTDPIADPISDADVLPIPSGKASFGAGAQLKNAIGNWSRWLTDLFGIDDDDLPENENSSEVADEEEDRTSRDASSKPFHLLNALSDLMMLPKDMLLSRTIRKEVCPTFGPPLIRRVLKFFIPDEFCPDPIPGVVLEALNSEDPFDSEEDCIMNFPCGAAAIVYQTPSATSVGSILGEFGGNSRLTRSGSSVLRKSQTSDDELDELDSPLKSIITDCFQSSPSSVKFGSVSKENGSRNSTLRYQLLREIWMNSE